MSSKTHPQLSNRLLSSLSAPEYQRLTTNAARIRLARGDILFNAGEELRYAYFPLSGMASLISVTEEGRTVEVAAVGSDGMLGLPAVLGRGRSPYQVVMQLSGLVVRVGTAALRSEFGRGARLHEMLLRHALGLLTQITQSAACHRFHTVEERLARWLLITRDHAASDTFNLTQEFLSQMLGVPRTSVTALAGAMQREGAITYGRGNITVLDARKLEAASCECYQIIARENKHSYAA